MAKTSPVVHFEMPYEDAKRMIEFYKQTFGWQAQMMGPEMGNYVVVQTGETNPKTQMPTEPGRINGGFFKSESAKPVPSVVIAVNDIAAASQAVKTAGGKVLGGGSPAKKTSEEPDDIPGVGLYSSFIDSEGNRVGMLQPAPMESEDK